MKKLIVATILLFISIKSYNQTLAGYTYGSQIGIVPIFAPGSSAIPYNNTQTTYSNNSNLYGWITYGINKLNSLKSKSAPKAQVSKFEYSYESWGAKEFGKSQYIFPEGGKIVLDLNAHTLTINHEEGNSITLALFGERVEQNRYVYYKCLDMDVSIIEFDAQDKKITVMTTFYEKSPTTYYYSLKLISKS